MLEQLIDCLGQRVLGAITERCDTLEPASAEIKIDAPQCHVAQQCAGAREG